MARAKVPRDTRIFVEVGAQRPEEVSFDPFGPFEVLWVITNGRIERQFIWLTARKTGIYVAFGGPEGFHLSYHTDGTVHWKVARQKLHSQKRQPLLKITDPSEIQSATVVINDEALARFGLKKFTNKPVDSVIYLDNRMLPEAIYYQVWIIPPFKHGDVPLMTDQPAHFHLLTHTVPWVGVFIYEQGKRGARKRNGVS